MRQNHGLGCLGLLIVILLAGCLSSQENAGTPEPELVPSDTPNPTGTPLVPSATPTTAPTTTPTPAPAKAVEHRIAIRVVEGEGEFYDRDSGETFVPRGNNYVRLDPQERESGGTQIYHSVFDPGLYDPEEIANAFQEMTSLGYNTVRVFTSQNTIGTSDGLSGAYMENVVDFLDLAREHELFIIFTQDWLPGGRYGRVLNQDCCETFNMNNVHFLTPAGLEANKMYFHDFISYLIEHDAAVEMVLSYQLRNELYFDMNFPPFSMSSGSVEGLNGKTYDMSEREQKEHMADENMVLWMDELRAAIRDVDPTALVSTGFFWPQEPNPARIDDPRYINTIPAIWESELDFIDLHPYPAAELSFEEYAENFGLEGMKEKPLVMGEFGVATANLSTLDAAAQSLMDWQVTSCEYGFDGWLMWAWDIETFTDFHNATDDEGQIARALAPLNRPDPCQPAKFDFIETNVALGKAVRASAVLPSEPPEHAVDGTGAQWGAGTGPPQWVEIDLGQTYDVKEIRLTVAQFPEGRTTHQVYVRGPSSSFQLVHTFQEQTRADQLLVFEPETPLEEVRYVRVATTQSPSWVAWKEIEVIEEPSP